MMKPFRRESSYPMVPVEEARQIIAAHIQPLATEIINSIDAAHRVLAEDIYAPEAVPDVPKATVDGYAVRADDGLQERCVLSELVAGTRTNNAVTITPGTAARIMTGAPLPEGADTVVMVEHTDEQQSMLRLHHPAERGANIRLVGDDMAQGEKILARGSIIGAAEIGLLAMVGQMRIHVYKRPRVAVLATGNELVEPDAPREAGYVRDSNRYALLAAAHEAGCETISLGIARDDVQVQRLTLLSGIEQADMVITSGGISMGTHDLIKPLLERLGTVHFGRVLFKPGKPTTFATIQDKPVFGLPGFPASSLVSFEVFVRPALRRMQGDAVPDRPHVRVTLGEPIRPSADRPEYQRAVLYWQDGMLVARSTGPQLSSRLLSLRSANALLIVPAGERVYEAGETLEAMLIGRIMEN
jgi:molybdopterin molybdotransferase